MRLAFKYKKSAGVRVSGGVHDLIRRANGARGALQWAVAADYYEAALEEDPNLYHIWIQLGHSRKEAGAIAAAESAYREAGRLRPDSGEPFLHMGHMFKVAGRSGAAARAYYEAVQVEPGNADAVSELHRHLARSTGADRARIVELLKSAQGRDLTQESSLAGAVARAREALTEVAAQGDPTQREQLQGAVAALDAIHARETSRGGGAGDKPALVFDASDLIGYYSHARLPTGIQRVQIEAISNALLDQDRDVRICCFIDGRDDWLEVPVSHFRAITELSVRSGERKDPEWIAALNRLHLTLALGDNFIFPDGAYLINLGTSWWLHNYFLFVRHAKAKHGIRYIPFVHDFIPIMTPEHCVKGLTQDFITWAVGVFEHADYFLVNSEATKRDLLRVAEVLEANVDPETVAVIRLDADFRKADSGKLGRQALAKWRLDEEPFVLFVSTIESRKGHVVAFDAWLELIHRHGGRKTPRLVCVGKNGWLNDPVYQRLATNDELASRVTMLSYLSDDELALLYRSCQFTIYPSLYEGWGLPITEALCYGKPVVAADSSSLPEAGGAFVDYVEAGSPTKLADAVEKMAFDDNWRHFWQAKIAADFHPRSWQKVAGQIESEIVRLAARDDAPAYTPPLAKLGAFHPITRNVETRIWPGIGSGEIFRTGLGWLWPDTWGCWTLPQGGGLAIGLPEQRGTVRVYLQLQNIPGHACPWRLRIQGLPTLRGELTPGERRWVSFDYPEDGGALLRLHLRGDWSETIAMVTSGQEKEYRASVGLCGFFVCEASDAAARSAFLEAAALGTVTDLDAYRERVPFTPLSDTDEDEDGWPED
jgi:glycosyltransferase involved in cell wall biosynthesis